MNKRSRIVVIFSLAVMLLISQMVGGNSVSAQTLQQSPLALRSPMAGQFDNNRLAGTDRFQTAVAIAKAMGAPNSTVIIVNGLNFPDALSAGPLAGVISAPILLTETDVLPSSTLQALKDLAIKKAVIVGGTGAVSTKVENAIKALSITVERLAGTDRFDTSYKVAEKIKSVVGQPTKVVVASGMGFADALSISPIAVANKMPILLTDTNAIPSSVQTYLNNNKAITQSYVIGGTGVITDAVKNKLTNPLRLGGVDRFDTNLKVLQHFDNDLYYNITFVASGLNYADALAGSVFAGVLRSPLVLTDVSMPSNSNSYVGKRLCGESRIFSFGGTGAVSDSVMQEVTNGLTPEGIDVGRDSTELAIGYAAGDSATSVTSNLTLPSTGRYGSTIVWVSTKPEIISDTGIVVRPSTKDETVEMVAILKIGEVRFLKYFDVTVKMK